MVFGRSDIQYTDMPPDTPTYLGLKRLESKIGTIAMKTKTGGQAENDCR
jgi:hypothetical protein